MRLYEVSAFDGHYMSVHAKSKKEAAAFVQSLLLAPEFIVHMNGEVEFIKCNKKVKPLVKRLYEHP